MEMAASSQVRCVSTWASWWSDSDATLADSSRVAAEVFQRCEGLLSRADATAAAFSPDLLLRTCSAARRLLQDSVVDASKALIARTIPPLPFDDALLSMGAVEAAAERALATLSQSFALPLEDGSLPEKPWGSSNLRALRMLVTNAPVRATALLMSARHLSLFVSTVLELAAPVVLPADWAPDAVTLRRWALDAIRDLTDACLQLALDKGFECASVLDDGAFAAAGSNSRAAASDGAMSVHAAVGTRGLFLLAYQGSSLLKRPVGEGDLEGFTDDQDLPAAYFELLKTLGPAGAASAGPLLQRRSGTSIRVGFLSALRIILFEPMFNCYSIWYKKKLFTINIALGSLPWRILY